MITADSGLNLLLMVGTPTLYEHNAFRLTGLLVTTTAREVARYGDRLKLLQEVGGLAAAGLPTLLDERQAPGPDGRREALRNLRDIHSRTLHEFFWLWPDDWAKPEADTAFSALQQRDLKAAKAIWTAREAESACCIATHNLAVLGHMRALDLSLQDVESPLLTESRNEMHAEWRLAMKRWWRIAEDDDLWDHYKARISQIDDPSVTTGLARRLRGDLLWAFDRIIATLAVAYAERKRRIECQWHVGFLKSYLGGDGEALHRATDHALASVRERLDHALQNARRQTQAEEIEGIAKARLLLETAAPLLKVLELVQPSQAGCRDCENIGRGALDTAVAGYNLIYCAKDPSPAVLARRGERRHAEEYIRIMAKCRALTTDTDLQKTIDFNIQIAEVLLQRMPPEMNFEYSLPRQVNGRKRVDPEQRPRWSTLFLHSMRIVPRSVWMLFVIIAASVSVSLVVNFISSKPVATGKFTPVELAVHGLPQRVGTQSFLDLPSTGELQRSPSLRSHKVFLQFTSTDATGTHFYAVLNATDMPDESLAVFIRGGDSADIWLPDQDYDLIITWGRRWNDARKRFETPNQQKMHLSKLSRQQATVVLMATNPDGGVDIAQHSNLPLHPR